MSGISKHLGSQTGELLKSDSKRLQAASLAGRTTHPHTQDTPTHPPFTTDTALMCLPDKLSTVTYITPHSAQYPAIYLFTDQRAARGHDLHLAEE